MIYISISYYLYIILYILIIILYILILFFYFFIFYILFIYFYFISIQKKVRNYKLEKHGLGCAIHMKEYRIMMYLANQIPWSNKEPF